jgi:hypothetical protein
VRRDSLELGDPRLRGDQRRVALGLDARARGVGGARGG